MGSRPQASSRPQVISPKDLAKAVDQAVKAVQAKHNATFSNEFHIGPGTIMGRIIRNPDLPINQAEQIAAEITQHVTQNAAAPQTAAAVLPRFEPAVLIRNGIILCGFLPGPLPEIEQVF